MFEHLPAEFRLLVTVCTILLVTALTAWLVKHLLNRALGACPRTQGFENKINIVLQCDLLNSIKQHFDREGIEIPFSQTTLSFGKNEILMVSTVDGGETR